MPDRPVLAALATERGYFAIRAREVTVGRSRACDIALAAPTISAKHAQLVLLDGGEARLTDCSRTGTTVNGIRVHGGSVFVRDGDEIRFGLGAPLFRFCTGPPGERGRPATHDASTGADALPAGMRDATVATDLLEPQTADLAARECAAQASQTRGGTWGPAPSDASAFPEQELHARPEAPARESVPTVLHQLAKILREADGGPLAGRLPTLPPGPVPAAEADLLEALRGWVTAADSRAEKTTRRLTDALLADVRDMRTAASLLRQDYTAAIRRLAEGTSTAADELAIAQARGARLASRLQELAGPDAPDRIRAWDEHVGALLEVVPGPPAASACL